MIVQIKARPRTKLLHLQAKAIAFITGSSFFMTIPCSKSTNCFKETIIPYELCAPVSEDWQKRDNWFQSLLSLPLSLGILSSFTAQGNYQDSYTLPFLLILSTTKNPYWFLFLDPWETWVVLSLKEKSMSGSSFSWFAAFPRTSVLMCD